MIRVKNIAATLWTHKKKAVVATGALVYLTTYVNQSSRDTRIRAFFAAEARKYGDQSILPKQRLGRVTVLINREANQRKSLDLFNKNALPLLHLAGLDVNVIQVKNAEEMESLASVLDRSETDCIFVVGGDGTLSRVLAGAMNKVKKPRIDEEKIPLAVFPGGKENHSLVALVPNVFVMKDDVRRYCESAMAIIENSRQSVFPIKCEIVNNADATDSKTFYLLSSLSAGWFEHCEQRKHKLWYWRGLKSKVVYLLEFLKRYPESMSFRVSYANCDGCNKCRKAIEKKPENWSWLRMLIGVPNKKNNGETRIDYSKIINEKCGALEHMSLDATDLKVSCVQAKGCSKLNFQSGGTGLGRFGSIGEGMRRCAEAKKGMPGAKYDTEFQGSKIFLQFMFIPAFIRKLSIAGDWWEFDNFAEKTICLESMDEKIELFLPKPNVNRFNMNLI